MGMMVSAMADTAWARDSTGSFPTSTWCVSSRIGWSYGCRPIPVVLMLRAPGFPGALPADWPESEAGFLSHASTGIEYSRS